MNRFLRVALCFLTLFAQAHAGSFGAGGASTVDPYTITELAGANPLTNLTGKTQVSGALIAERTAIIITVGQSLQGNTVSALYTPSHAKVQNFDIYNGGLYTAVDPLLSADTNTINFSNVGNVAGRIGDKLIDGNRYDRVILVPIAIGGTSAAQWATNAALLSRITVTARRLATAGYTATFVLWEQGQADVSLGTTALAYTASVQTVKANFVAAGITAPMLVALSTVIANSSNATIRSGQSGAVSVPLNIGVGPDIDTYASSTYRYDGIHMNATGADAQATAWVASIGTWIDAH